MWVYKSRMPTCVRAQAVLKLEAACLSWVAKSGYMGLEPLCLTTVLQSAKISTETPPCIRFDVRHLDEASWVL